MPASEQLTPQQVFDLVQQGFEVVAEGIGKVVNATRGPQGQVVVESESGQLYQLDGSVTAERQWIAGVNNGVALAIGAVVLIFLLQRSRA